MALIRCKNCGHQISDKAKNCPKCGTENVIDESKSSSDETLPLPSHIEEQTDPTDEVSQVEDTENNHKTLYLLPTLLILLIGCSVGYYFYIDHQNRIAENLRLEQLRKDSIVAAEREAARLDSLRQDSIERRNFTSPDLAFAELHGKVKTCVWESKVSFLHYDGELTFSEDGTLSPHKGHKFVRNKEGRITNVKYKEYYSDQDFFDYSYVWKDGRIVSNSYTAWEASGDSKYFYDDNGLLKKETSESSAEGTNWLSTVIYSDYEFDKWGNWVKREVKIMSTESYDGEDSTTDTAYYTETRTITYDNGYVGKCVSIPNDSKRNQDSQADYSYRQTQELQQEDKEGPEWINGIWEVSTTVSTAMGSMRVYAKVCIDRNSQQLVAIDCGSTVARGIYRISGNTIYCGDLYIDMDMSNQRLEYGNGVYYRKVSDKYL